MWKSIFKNRLLKIRMKVRLPLLLFLAFSIFLSSCATSSQSRWASMGLAAPVGILVGALSAPENEKPTYHAFAWGSAFVAGAAIFGNYYYSDDKEMGSLREELMRLKSPPRFELLTEGEGYFNDPLKNTETPVSWKVYKIDKWIPSGEGIKYHQDMMIKREKK